MERRIAENKQSGSIAEELLAYVLKHKLSVIFVWAFTILVYGVWLAQNLVTFDAEGFFDSASSRDWYADWLRMGRWSLILFKDIFHVKLINPFFQITIFGIFFPASMILWWFCFYRWNRNREYRFSLLLFSCIYLSHPVWATQFSYRNQMESITFLMCLLPIALLLLTERRPEGRVPRLIISAVFTVLCFGGYQSFMFMYGEGVILYLLFRLYHDYSENNRKDFWREVLFLSAFTIVCFGACSVISRMICARHGLSYGLEYLNRQFHWGSYPASENIQIITERLKSCLAGDDAVYNSLGIIEIAAGAALIFAGFRGRTREGILGALLYIASWTAPFLLLFVTASPIVDRSQFAFVLALAFWGTIELGELVRILTGKQLTDGRVILAALIFMLVIFPQIQKNTRLLYTEYMTMYTDEIQLRTIYYQALEKGAHEGDPIVFINGKNNYVNEAMIEHEVVGFSYFEFNGLYSGTKIIEAMRAYGMNVSFPTDEQRDVAAKTAEGMETWPNAGGIAVQNGIIIVKL